MKVDLGEETQNNLKICSRSDVIGLLLSVGLKGEWGKSKGALVHQ